MLEIKIVAIYFLFLFMVAIVGISSFIAFISYCFITLCLALASINQSQRLFVPMILVNDLQEHLYYRMISMMAPGITTCRSAGASILLGFHIAYILLLKNGASGHFFNSTQPNLAALNSN